MQKINNILLLIAVLASMSFVYFYYDDDTNVITVETTPVNHVNSYYVANKVPLQPVHFIKLPITSIKPNGWIKKYLELQRDGLTGRLGEISAWLDKNNNAWYSG